MKKSGKRVWDLIYHWYHWTIKNCPGNKGKSDIVDPEIAHLLHLEIL